jgi:uncharacterized membrane protein (DUF485 family)
MMFAITIGEVGLQAAALVQAGHPAHFLPAYGHLVLATVVVATSWVGWSLSVAPGARRDVQGVFKGEFFVLLLDVALVIAYFILVRTIDFGKEATPPRTEPASTVAGWILVIFILYLVWDILTKIIISWGGRERSTRKLREHFDRSWRRSVGSRMLPTAMCCVLAWVIWRLVQTADAPHYLTADCSLLWLMLLFRALKELVSAYYPTPPKGKPSPPPRPPMSKKSAMVLTVVCALGMAVGAVWTAGSWPLPARIVTAIETELPREGSRAETPAAPRQPERPSIGDKASEGAHQR